MDDLLDTATRCPHCRAAARPDAPWCTLCHADLRPPPPAPEPPVAPSAPVLTIPPTAAYGAPALDPLTAPVAALATPSPALPSPAPPALPSPAAAPPAADPTWPCASCGAANALTADACAACGAGFLAGLRASEAPLLELPGVGDITRLSRGQRMALAFGVVAAVVALIALLGLLLG